MGRNAKKVQDWSVTLAIKGDLQEVPEPVLRFLESDDVSHCYAVAEHAAQWHVHIAMRTRRKYGSDYWDWFKNLLKDDMRFAHDKAIEVKYHDDVVILAGGYCTKSEYIPLYGKGFTKEQLIYGADQHVKRLERKRVREFVDKHLVLTREKFAVALGATIAEGGEGTTPEAAAMRLLDQGWAFSSSLDRDNFLPAVLRYSQNYVRHRDMSLSGDNNIRLDGGGNNVV